MEFNEWKDLDIEADEVNGSEVEAVVKFTTSPGLVRERH